MKMTVLIVASFSSNGCFFLAHYSTILAHYVSRLLG